MLRPKSITVTTGPTIALPRPKMPSDQADGRDKGDTSNRDKGDTSKKEVSRSEGHDFLNRRGAARCPAHRPGHLPLPVDRVFAVSTRRVMQAQPRGSRPIAWFIERNGAMYPLSLSVRPG
jgi:hypothetical protein